MDVTRAEEWLNSQSSLCRRECVCVGIGNVGRSKGKRKGRIKCRRGLRNVERRKKRKWYFCFFLLWCESSNLPSICAKHTTKQHKFLWFSNEFVSFCLSFVRLVLCFCNGFGLTLHAGRCAWEAFAYQQLFCSSPHQWRSRFFLDLHTKPMKGQTTFSLSLSQFTFGGLCGRAPPWRFRPCFNEPPES